MQRPSSGRALRASANSNGNGSNTNHLSSSRVKVAVRCRPAFQDEIDFAKGEFFSIVQTRAETPFNKDLGQVSLTMITGKQREFYFDYVFGEDAGQDYVYDRLARPVVNDVLKGCNGTIFAYGQTGTGKTYTMGILEFVNNEHAGLIPRAIHQIFEYVDNTPELVDATVSMSFLQLYRETIQDLLAPAITGGNVGEENLVIREDPLRGFYVEGLQEFAVRSYRESEALINLGLENRAIAPTLMNSTSSRSHTILTINIEQRLAGDNSYTRTLRSKLLMVDLAGSERVRRTVSKGTRLSEAKSINSSLSALGNVIAALAESNVMHIPYRDSKLTRLLQDSLGGTASTALIATIGPAAMNYGETLSTLLFAQRCMAVKITPTPHEEIDYAEMCAKLQAQVNAMEGVMTQKLLEQQTSYEATIQELKQKLDAERQRVDEALTKASKSGNEQEESGLWRREDLLNQELKLMLTHLEALRNEDSKDIDQRWFNKPVYWRADEDEKQSPDGRLLAVVGYSYELLKTFYYSLSNLLDHNMENEEIEKEALEKRLSDEKTNERQRREEISCMYKHDPLRRAGKEHQIGSHLAPLSTVEAITRVESQFPSNNTPLVSHDRQLILLPALPADLLRPSINNYKSVEELTVALHALHGKVGEYFQAMKAIMNRKDHHYKNLKNELSQQMVERRRREEEVVNWSYILKYLLASASKLRKQLQHEKKLHPYPIPIHRNFVTSPLPDPSPAPAKLSLQSPEDAITDGVDEGVLRSLGGDERNSKQMPATSNLYLSSAPKPDGPVMLSNAYHHAASAVVTEEKRPENVLDRIQQRIRSTQEQYIISSQQRETNSSSSQASSSYNGSRHHAGMLAAKQEATARALDGQDENEIYPSFAESPAIANRTFTPLPSQHSAGSSAQRPNVALTTAPQAEGAYSTRSYASFSTLTSHTGARTGFAGADGTERRREDVEEAEDGYGSSSQRFNLDDEYSLTSTTRSFRSAATPGSIPTPHYRKSRRKQAMLEAQQQQEHSPPQRQQNSPASQAQTAAKASRSISPVSRGAPSSFALEIAKTLGMQGSQAMAAMSVIDRISSITPDQLSALDDETRAQILHIRSELGLDRFIDSSRHRREQAEQSHIQRSRAASAPRRLNQSASTSPNQRKASPAPLVRTASSSPHVGRMETSRPAPRRDIRPVASENMLHLPRQRTPSPTSRLQTARGREPEQRAPTPGGSVASASTLTSRTSTHNTFTLPPRTAIHQTGDSDEEDDEDGYSQLDMIDSASSQGGVASVQMPLPRSSRGGRLS